MVARPGCPLEVSARVDHPWSPPGLPVRNFFPSQNSTAQGACLGHSPMMSTRGICQMIFRGTPPRCPYKAFVWGIRSWHPPGMSSQKTHLRNSPLVSAHGTRPRSLSKTLTLGASLRRPPNAPIPGTRPWCPPIVPAHDAFLKRFSEMPTPDARPRCLPRRPAHVTCLKHLPETSACGTHPRCPSGMLFQNAHPSCLPKTPARVTCRWFPPMVTARDTLLRCLFKTPT